MGGFAIIMFGLLLFGSVMMVTVITYGVMKDNQIAPLKAENIYAERETGKAQTELTIVNTCLSGEGRYIEAKGAGSNIGPHELNLTVKNRGSIVLNPIKATVLYNASYINFTVTSSGNVWTPLTNASLKVENIYINPISPIEGPELGLLVAAENGVSAIAPTSPTNFTGFNNGNRSFTFSWNASEDDKGVDHYILYAFFNNFPVSCPRTPDIIKYIPSNQTSAFPCNPCPNTYAYVTAVDIDGNMGVPSKTLKCEAQSNKPCSN